MAENWLGIIDPVVSAKIVIGVGMKILASANVHAAEEEVAEVRVELEKQDIERQTLVQEMETLQKEIRVWYDPIQ